MTAGAVLIVDAEPGPVPAEPPAFIDVFGRSLLEICAETLDRCPEIRGFVVVTPKGLEDRVADSVGASAKFLGAIAGGADTRESVVAGIEALPQSFERVAVHDVARPLASPGLFAAVIRALDGADAAVPRLPVSDTLKRVEDGVVRETVPRDGLGALQTPLGFRRQALMSFLGETDMPEPEGSTDLLWFVVAPGFRVETVPAEPANVEVRTAEDYGLVERLLAQTAGRGHGR